MESGRHPMIVFMMSLWTRNLTSCSCLSSFPLKKTVCPSAVVVSPKFFHLISQSPKMFHQYLSSSCASSWRSPAAPSVSVFHVLLVMSLPRILDGAPVACLTPPSWCTAEGAVLVNPGSDRFGRVWLLSCHVDSSARYNLTEPIPLQVEHVAVKFVVEPLRPPSPSLRTMRTSAK